MPGPLLDLQAREFRHQIEVNLTGQLIVTQAFAPLLGADPSLTGPPRPHRHDRLGRRRRGFPFMGAYAASKLGLEGLSESLRRELMLFGIDVIVIAPGMVDTPIWDKADSGGLEADAGGPYAQPLRNIRAYMSGPDRGRPAAAIAAVVLAALTRKQPKARYALRRARWSTLPCAFSRRAASTASSPAASASTASRAAPSRTARGLSQGSS